MRLWNGTIVLAGLAAVSAMAPAGAQPARIEPALCVFQFVRAPNDVPPVPRAALSGTCETGSRVAYQSIESGVIDQAIGRAGGRMRAVFADVARARNLPLEVAFEVERGISLGSSGAPARCEFVEQRTIVCRRQP